MSMSASVLEGAEWYKHIDVEVYGSLTKLNNQMLF